MATMNTVLAQVDALKPNACTDEDKCRWIGLLEGLVSIEVYDEQPPVLRFPEDADRELRLQHPYDELYSLYVMAMIDFANREYGSFNNTLLVFRERLEQLKAYHLRTRKIAAPSAFRRIMG